MIKKPSGLVALGLIFFVFSLICAAVISGVLDKDGYDKHETPGLVATDKEDINSLIESIKNKEKRLSEREEKIALDEVMLQMQQVDLEQLREESNKTLKELKELVETEDAAHIERLKDAAKSVESMDPGKAAKILGGFEIEEAVSILRYIRDRNKGEILNEMDSDKAASLLEALVKSKF